jgi:hypothetical protein
MKKTVLLMLFASVLGCSTVPRITNREELNAHAVAMIRTGVKDKDECKTWYCTIGKDLPLEASKPVNTAAIEKYYKKLSSDDPYANIRLMYNMERIDKQKYHELMAQKAEQLYLESVAALQRFQALNQMFPATSTSYQNTYSTYTPRQTPLYAPSYTTPTTIITPAVGSTAQRGTYLGQWSANKYDANSINNQYGAGSQYKQDGLKNPYSEYGNPYSSKSPKNPYATDTPKLYDRDGNYRGKLSNNAYDPDSISNPYGRYGNKYSPDSVNNPYGAGNPYSPNSPANPYGQGLSIFGAD